MHVTSCNHFINPLGWTALTAVIEFRKHARKRGITNSSCGQTKQILEILKADNSSWWKLSGEITLAGLRISIDIMYQLLENFIKFFFLNLSVFTGFMPHLVIIHLEKYFEVQILLTKIFMFLTFLPIPYSHLVKSFLLISCSWKFHYTQLSSKFLFFWRKP